MGAVGVCWDNAVAESFFSHMKTEMYYQQHFDNHLAARTAVMEYIESWYNRRRLSSVIGYQTPIGWENHYRQHTTTLAAQQPCPANGGNSNVRGTDCHS